MKLVNESLNEFKKGLDPIDSLGLGRHQLIQDWFEKINNFVNITYKKGISYRILDDGSIDLFRNFFLNEEREDLLLTEDGKFPDYIQFNKVMGNFTIDNTKITSLRGFPKEIQGKLTITSNRKLQSLEYITPVIESMYGEHPTCDLSDNDIRTLEGLPDRIHWDLYLTSNKNLVIKGLPSYINGNLELPSKFRPLQSRIKTHCHVTGIIRFN